MSSQVPRRLFLQLVTGAAAGLAAATAVAKPRPPSTGTYVDSYVDTY